MESQARLEAQQAELEQTNVQLEEYAQRLERQKSDLLRAQDELAANALRLEQSSRYKSEFLANMSHELRTPLNSSLILAKLLQENRTGNLTEEQVRYAETIHSSNSDLLVLINDILDLSKVEAGQMDVSSSSTRVDRRDAAGAASNVQPPAGGSMGARIRHAHAENVPEYFVTDGQRLTQILRNLLSNAVKFTERGEVTVAVERAGDNALRIDVRDSGIGIARDKQDMIFEAFQQADGSTSRQYGGSGLGLSISREFSRLLGGRITVSSEVGQGQCVLAVAAARCEAAGASEGTVDREARISACAGHSEATPEPPRRAARIRAAASATRRRAADRAGQRPRPAMRRAATARSPTTATTASAPAA